MKVLHALISCLLLACCLTTQAQGIEQQFFPPATQNVSIANDVARPLVVIGSQETTSDALILDPTNIQHLNVYKGEKAVEKFGDKGKEGVVVVELKETVPLARLPEIFEQFNVSKKGQTLTVAIDGKHVSEPELLLADLRQIKKVEVKPFDVTAPSRWTFDEEYLNIVTVQ
ncbi:hypothetical protein DXT99_21705 [Pontibacter diazotrophicus]|uniref:TonB-dependent receptor plug domain-containing protein n=1 Tax=Pontibacter diazotrophicus TaxID=1400979 RepID=A0A3D8L6I6_9BACT|nr:hypothetical protein [Pontibacter diazotrophicus]RDV12997.1 hypothetical protein DXT99_21705 [Pontibacter diazotrophicus]